MSNFMHRLTRVAVIGLVLSSAVSATVIPSVGAEFYTRKRINGRWVEGYFPKESERARPDREAQPAIASTQVPEPSLTTGTEPPFTLGLHFAAQNQQEPGQSAREGVEDPQLPASDVVTTGSTKVRQPTVVRRSVRRGLTHVARVPRPPERPAVAASQNHEHRALKPAQAHVPKADAPSKTQSSSGTNLPATPAPPTENAPETTGDHYRRLAEVLVAKARALASGLISSVSEPVPPPKVEPISVADDYLTGIKTFAYSSGTLDEERFNTTTGVAATSKAPGSQ